MSVFPSCSGLSKVFQLPMVSRTVKTGNDRLRKRNEAEARMLNVTYTVTMLVVKFDIMFRRYICWTRSCNFVIYK